MKNTEILHLIDIGNTSATYGLAIHGKISKVTSMASSSIPEKIFLNAKKGLNLQNIVIISSVVPKKSDFVISELNARGNFTVYEVGKNIPAPLKSLYENQSNLGMDRKINAFGAIFNKKLPCLVFDYGTALTCDLINEKGVFLGGLIIPGPLTSLKTLLSGTAQLPKIFKLHKKTDKPYGRNTNDCIQYGVIQAYAAMTDGLINRLSKEFTKKPYVIITGGFSEFIGKIIKSKAEINPAHTIQSILDLYLDWKS